MSPQRSIPESIVVYSYHGHAVYFDGQLKRYLSIDSSISPYTIGILCDMLGVKFEHRQVRWEEWPETPGVESSRKVYHAPQQLSAVEDHFARVERRKKEQRLTSAKAEVVRLEQELGL